MDRILSELLLAIALEGIMGEDEHDETPAEFIARVVDILDGSICIPPGPASGVKPQ
jgi:hypothetical protein